MNGRSTLVMASADHEVVMRHLFPGDGKEAAAILVCTRHRGERLKLLVKEVVRVPYEVCQREVHRLTWPSAFFDDLLDRCQTERLSLVLIHSHPSGYPDFSDIDDISDQHIMPYLYPYGHSDHVNDLWHGTAIMLPSGAIKARLYNEQAQHVPISLVAIYGDDLRLCWHDMPDRPAAMAFTDDMRDEIGRLSVAIIGVSGTGSVVAEQLLRLGVGELIVIDDDRVEKKNLNRILNTTQNDAETSRYKVDVFRDAAARVYGQARVRTVPLRIGTLEAIEAAAEADIIFSCVDSQGGRQIADRLAAAMIQPLFDVGVLIPVRHPENGPVISNVSGRIDYVQPKGSSLSDRRVYTPQRLAQEDLRERDPARYAAQVQEGYMPGTNEEAPSVITVNMRAASAVVQELIARLYPYRIESNALYARTKFCLAAEEHEYSEESSFPRAAQVHAACGLGAPLLGLPALEDLRCN